MIQANELRLGNIISYRGEIFEIFDLISKSSVELDSEKLDRHVSNANLNNIYPVEISEEILLKCGFEAEIGRFGNEYHFDNFVLYTSENGSISFVWDNYIKDVPYLHEAQNLYFSLNKKELNTSKLTQQT